MHHCIANFKRFKEGTAERNLFLEQNQTIMVVDFGKHFNNKINEIKVT